MLSGSFLDYLNIEKGVPGCTQDALQRLRTRVRTLGGVIVWVGWGADYIPYIIRVITATCSRNTQFWSIYDYIPYIIRVIIRNLQS